MTLEARQALACDTGRWLTAHVSKIAKGFHLDSHEAEDLRQDAALWLLTSYLRSGSFDKTRYPQRAGETVAEHSARVERKFRAHAGISVLRKMGYWVRRNIRRALPVVAIDKVLEELVPVDDAPPRVEFAVERELARVELLCNLAGTLEAAEIARLIYEVRDNSRTLEELVATCPAGISALRRYAKTHLTGE